MSGTLPLFPIYAFMAWKGTLPFYFYVGRKLTVTFRKVRHSLLSGCTRQREYYIVFIWVYSIILYLCTYIVFV
jgi:hypothetical protein